jgi:hypothetical protein
MKKYTIDYLKREAKKLKKEKNIKYSEALELIAADYGFRNWQHCIKTLNKEPKP